LSLAITEWRKIILLFFTSGIKYHFSYTKEAILENYKPFIDKNFEPAFNSLVRDGFIIPAYSNDSYIYSIDILNLDKIKFEIFNPKAEYIDAFQPFERNFTNMTYQFESETDRNIPNKGKYYHFTKSGDDTFWISVVKTKGSSKSNKLIVGSLNDPQSRLFKIRKAILTITRQTGTDTFIKKNVEDIEPKACGNSRQFSRAALDILEYLGLIRAIRSKGRSPIYIVTAKIFIGIEELMEKSLKYSRQASIEEFLEQKD
jgi:hypothetical protein